jgi:hypothetical protein
MVLSLLEVPRIHGVEDRVLERGGAQARVPLQVEEGEPLGDDG